MISHYTVEGQPGTWSDHSSLESAIQRAQQLGVRLVHSIEYTVVERGPNRGHSGVSRRVAWASDDCPACLLPASWQWCGQ